MIRLGSVVLVAVLQIPPTSISDDNEAGAGCLGSSAPDTASDDDKTLGPVYEVAVLQIPPVTLDYDIITGTGVCGSCAPDTASNCWIK